MAAATRANPTLGAVTVPDPAQRVSHIPLLAKDPETRPDLAPVDLGSFNIDPWDAAARRRGRPRTSGDGAAHALRDDPGDALAAERIRAAGREPAQPDEVREAIGIG